MGRYKPLPLGVQAFADDTLPWAAQDCCNWIPVRAEATGALTEWMLRGAPGLVVIAGVGNGPCRGLHDAEGSLFGVSGGSAYRIYPDGTSASIGTIPGTGRVSIAHNKVTGGSEIVFANGSSGYVYNTVAGALSQIADAGFPGAKVVDFVDNYIAGVDPQGLFWFISDLAQATSYNTLDRADAEAQPDKIVTLIVSNRQVLVLGSRTGQFFRNAGTATGTFQNVDGAEMDVGCAGTFAIARFDNTVVWLGHNGIVYRLNGYQPVRISTHAIEQKIGRGNMAQAVMFTYQDQGHEIVYLTIPNGQTWGYDAATLKWHRRESYGLKRWRVNALVRSNGQWIGGDYASGKLYRLEWDHYLEGCEPLVAKATGPAIYDAGNRFILDELRLEIDSSGVESADPAAPIITGDLPDGFVGEVVSYQYTITPAYPGQVVTLSLTGALPAGLTMDSAGLVTGTRA